MSLAPLTACQTGIICEAQFAPIPSGKRLVATNITGVIDLDTPGVLDSCVDFVSNTVPYCFPTTLQTGVFAGLNHIGINAAIGLFIDGPDQPVLGLVGKTRIFGPFSHVALSGYSCSTVPRRDHAHPSSDKPVRAPLMENLMNLPQTNRIGNAGYGILAE